MSTETRRIVDSEELRLARPPFANSRMLGMFGGILFGLTARLMMPETARAAIPENPTPPPCSGYDGCNCCSGVVCCDAGGCSASSGGCSQGDGQCWYTCTGGTYYECCDYYSVNGGYGQGYPNNCICSVFAGRC